MLDFDLAKIYGIETKRLKEQVKRNIERFPDDFMFQLRKSEWAELVANCDQLPQNIKHSYILPMAFTQEGIAMLSGVLKSPMAIKMNIAIMRAFVHMRAFVLDIKPSSRITELEKQMQNLKRYIEDAFTDYNDINEDTRIQLELINQSLAELQASKKSTIEKPRR